MLAPPPAGVIEHAGERAVAGAARAAHAGSRRPHGSRRRDNALRYVVAAA